MKKLLAIVAALCLAACAASADSAGTLPAATSASPGMVYVAELRNGFTLRFDHRSIMQDTSRLYTSPGEADYIDVPTEEIVSVALEALPAPPRAAVSGTPVEDTKSMVAAASDKHLVDADLIDSIIRAESGFNPKAVSRKGARGLMQLMPETAAKLGVENSFDGRENVDGGTRYLRELLARYNNDLAKALAAYNAGPRSVDQYRGVPPYRETQAYVAGVIRDFNRKKLAARKAQNSKRVAGKAAAAAPAPHAVPGS